MHAHFPKLNRRTLGHWYSLGTLSTTLAISAYLLIATVEDIVSGYRKVRGDADTMGINVSTVI
jgi:hypothetical protein